MLRQREAIMAANETIAALRRLRITEEPPNAEVCKCGKPSVFNEATQLYVGCCQDCIPF